MKKMLLLLLLLVSMVWVCVGTGAAEEVLPPEVSPTDDGGTISAEDLDIDDFQTTMSVGTSQMLVVTVIPVSSTDSVVYTSLNPEIASVNALGRVRALNVGSADIVISAGSVSRTIPIHVQEPETEQPVLPTALDITCESNMLLGTTQTLMVAFLPSDATGDVSYSSSDPQIASVNAFGKVTAQSVGSVTITASCGYASASVVIHVQTDEPTYIPVQVFDVGEVATTMTVGTSQTIVVSVLPANATNQTASYTSSNSNVLTVNAFGRISANAPGTATVTVTVDGRIQTIPITVEEEQIIRVQEIDIGDVQQTMMVGTTQMVNVSIFPANATNQTASYASSDSNVLTVNAFGRISANAPGTATVTVTVDGRIQTIPITVKEEQIIRVQEIDIGEVQQTMTVGTSQTIVLNVLPADATNQTASYASSDSNVLTVNAFGRVSALNPGSAELIISVDGLSRTVAISVEEERHVVVQEIDLGEVSSEMTVGTSQSILVSVFPTDAENQTAYYSTTDASVLTVNTFGRVTALKAGSASITVQVGEVRKSVTITATEEIVPASIEIGEFADKMKIDGKQTLQATVLPTDAKEQKITYSSSNHQVAKISQNGAIEAVGKGQTTITLSCGTVIKQLTLTVYVPTEEIAVGEKNVMLHPGESYLLSPIVKPETADQIIKYQSTDPEIASVSAEGEVSAFSIGVTSILLSNEDTIETVTIIVNQKQEKAVQAETGSIEWEKENENTQLLEAIKQNQNADVFVKYQDYPCVTKDVLATLYECKKHLVIDCDSYIVTILGDKIKNPSLEYDPAITWDIQSGRIEIRTSEGVSLPGTILIDVSRSIDILKYRYLYMYDPASGQYKKLAAFNDGVITVNLPGQYCLSESKIKQSSIPVYIYFVGSGIIISGVVLYIVFRRKYWFW